MAVIVPIVKGILIGAAIVGGITAGVGTIISGVKQKEIAEENIAQGERDIKYIEGKTTETVEELRLGGQQFLHRQRAAIGASGTKATGESPLLLLQETATKIAADIARLKKASKHEIERIESAGEQYQSMGEAALWGGILGGGSTFLTQLGNTYTTGSLMGWW